ncbi:hypothetical protein CPB84DRAFT_312731 [Gymnopilus junonius]|uniref:Uncharacterized protein n=1 Tax=Gymnopilus junonius TaxID=109634 RepID=A0A9P5NAZ6_GYMJU|nr:hypothetical protein CPB84DRAFT_312731 [Gymnopilus junonius]
MPRPKNPYGFDRRRRPYLQLFEILPIARESEDAKSLMRNLVKICAKYYSLHDPPSIQTESLGRIENELKRRYPQFFGGKDEVHEQRRYFALQVTMELHNQSRSSQKKELRKQLNGHQIVAYGSNVQQLTGYIVPQRAGGSSDVPPMIDPTATKIIL